MLKLLILVNLQLHVLGKNLHLAITQKNVQKRAKLIALHAQKMRKSSQKNICAKNMVISWKPYSQPPWINAIYRFPEGFLAPKSAEPFPPPGHILECRNYKYNSMNSVRNVIACFLILLQDSLVLDKMIIL